MSVLISVPIAMAISQYSNLNHVCGGGADTRPTAGLKLAESLRDI